MAAVQEIRAGGRRLELHRPLLALRRDQLRDYLRKRRIRWREDATNAEPITARNRLRHEALPLLSEIAGRDVISTITRAAEASRDAAAILAWALDQAAVTDPQGRLHLPALRELPPSLQRAAIHRFLTQSGIPDIDHPAILRCQALIDPAAPPSTNLPRNHRLRRRAGRLFVDG